MRQCIDATRRDPCQSAGIPPRTRIGLLRPQKMISQETTRGPERVAATDEQEATSPRRESVVVPRTENSTKERPTNERNTERAVHEKGVSTSSTPYSPVVRMGVWSGSRRTSAQRRAEHRIYDALNEKAARAALGTRVSSIFSFFLTTGRDESDHEGTQKESILQPEEAVGKEELCE
ncbi:hypothetical protein TRVL_05283 [Trypanosoma vivax]|nr:hypothetical protein TRVL_05283 [Trypanosoma vivax]